MDFLVLFNFLKDNKMVKNGVKAAKDAYNGNAENDVKMAQGLFNRHNAGGNSIKFQARESIAQYPVLVSDSLSFKTIQTVNGALEAQYASMLALVLQNAASNEGKSAGAVLKQYHNNLHHNRKLEMEFNVQESTGNKYFLCGVDSKSALREANIELLKTHDELLNEDTLNSITYTRDFMNILEEAGKDDEDDDDGKKDKKKIKSNGVKLTSTEVKKANEITPTMLSMNINFDNGKGGFVEKEVTIGVKCVSHLLLSDDIEYYLTRTVFTNSPIIRLLQWSTGEISFFKDLIFAVDDMKKNAIKANSQNGYWWRKLETISKTAKANKSLGEKATGKPQPIPVATMVISKEDVDRIKFRHGFNLLEKVNMIQKIINNFYLLNFLIVDEGTDTFYMYNEDTKVLDRYPKSAFEKMSKKDSLDVEELYKMLK